MIVAADGMYVLVATPYMYCTSKRVDSCSTGNVSDCYDCPRPVLPLENCPYFACTPIVLQYVQTGAGCSSNSMIRPVRWTPCCTVEWVRPGRAADCYYALTDRAHFDVRQLLRPTNAISLSWSGGRQQWPAAVASQFDDMSGSARLSLDRSRIIFQKAAPHILYVILLGLLSLVDSTHTWGYHPVCFQAPDLRTAKAVATLDFKSTRRKKGTCKSF